jgi:hypothetical protein
LRVPSRLAAAFTRVKSGKAAEMKTTLAFLVVCLAALASLAAADSKKKLQIGVKKRVEDCKMRSRKGDFLHMHYTVSSRRNFWAKIAK